MDQAWEGEEVGCRQASGTVRGQIPETGSGPLETALLPTLLSITPRPSRSESTESPETAPAGAPPGEHPATPSPFPMALRSAQTCQHLTAPQAFHNLSNKSGV